MKRIITAALLTSALLAAPVAQAASYQDRAMATGAVVGSSHNQAVQGAIFGAVLGTIAGVVISSQHQPVHVVKQHPRPHYKPVAHHKHRAQKVYYSRSNNRNHGLYADSHSYRHERGDRH